jgi:hypothetical protein
LSDSGWKKEEKSRSAAFVGFLCSGHVLIRLLVCSIDVMYA